MTVFMVYTENHERAFGEHSRKEMYDFLRGDSIPHEEAADAVDWCELAAPGEEYESDYIHVVVEEE